MSAVAVVDERMRLRDGSLLATDVAAVDGRAAPALLIRTPYGRAAARDAYDLVGLAREGWSVVLQDVRGRGDSAGTFMAFDQEGADGADAVAWCAGQPWCDGRVVMTGISYLGAAQWAAAAAAPSGALTAINPVLAPTATATDALWEGGAFALGLAQPWMLGLLASAPDVDEAVRRRAMDLAGDWPSVARRPPADDPVKALSPAYRRWREHDRGSAAHPGPGRVPAFQVAGWFDVFCESALRAHAAQVEAGVPAVTVVGPWTHNERLTNLTPEWDFGPLGNGDMGDVRGEARRWLRSRLTGAPAESTVRYFVMGTNQWRSAATWPPPAEPRRLFLTGVTLSAHRPRQAGERVWMHDPSDPVPSRGGRMLAPLLPLPGPVDQRPVETRPDVLLFTSDPLRAPVTVAGVVTADVVVSSSACALDVAVKLCDVQPDGRSMNVVDGIQAVDVSPGRPTSVRVTVGSTAHAFGPGHRIRVEVAASNFPRFDLNPGDRSPRGGATGHVKAEHRVHWGGAETSSLLLPVVDGVAALGPAG